jgi:hypothetical protein
VRLLKSFQIEETKRIVVPENFEVQNGLIGIYRDTFLILVHSVGGEEKKMRALIGVGLETFLWSKHKYFLWILKTGMIVDLSVLFFILISFSVFSKYKFRYFD